jgi:hypothetical protein
MVVIFVTDIITKSAIPDGYRIMSLITDIINFKGFENKSLEINSSKDILTDG